MKRTPDDDNKEDTGDGHHDEDTEEDTSDSDQDDVEDYQAENESDQQPEQKGNDREKEKDEAKESGIKNNSKEPSCKGVMSEMPVIEELSIRGGESTTPHPSKELSAEKLPQGEGASAAPTDQEEPLLKGVIQKSPLEELSGESTTPHHSQGPTLDEFDILINFAIYH
ncbi:hypothetical protein KY290_010670 [Solanum tuberosum]|uniref:Uncharacterized protein n=1 Tax=Solanum tuberosum TaxID=4113 RepID=A0ABQ7W0F9_SOLTU|nr:hypothetical protein KY290_010670 [Solanum tuberosum]